VSYTSSQTRKTLSYFILSSQKKSPFPEKQPPLKKPFNISVDLTGVKTLSWLIMWCTEHWEIQNNLQHES